MKKTIALLLIIATALVMVACAANENSDVASKENFNSAEKA